jgi:hypothetical protein
MMHNLEELTAYAACVVLCCAYQVHPDIAQGAVLNPLLQKHCEQAMAAAGASAAAAPPRFTELTGSAGDLAIIHPYMMHRTAPNPSGRARFACHPVR